MYAKQAKVTAWVGSPNASFNHKEIIKAKTIGIRLGDMLRVRQSINSDAAKQTPKTIRNGVINPSSEFITLPLVSCFWGREASTPLEIYKFFISLP